MFGRRVGRGYTELVPRDEIVARALEVVATTDVARLLSNDDRAELPFSKQEMAYALSKPDPARRLAARLAAKRAGRAALGGEVREEDFEVAPARGGPPRLLLAPRAAQRAAEIGAGRALVSLTHGLTHAAAVVLFVEPER
jgi:phosphopantetheinyl transferase (holo-ACP synthase)